MDHHVGLFPPLGLALRPRPVLRLLKQLGRHNKPIAVLNVAGYFDDLRRLLETTVRESFMQAACLELCRSFTDPAALLDYLEGYDAAALDVRHLKNI